jgi:4-aminobutyrate aminotransferase-like enzyme
LGLFVGIELATNREKLELAAAHASYIINRAKDYGILLSTGGPLTCNKTKTAHRIYQ